MSLQLAAQHLASKGRGPDTALVHMAPSEVKTLQAVARAHGGALTINPDTGLPEAGFLSSILPMIAGVGLTALSGGTLSPVMAGLLTGGGTALATGNLQKGLMAGLGAYGGAGLGAGLAGAGAQEAILQANPGLTAGEIAREMGTPGFVQPSVTDKMMAGFKGLGNEAGRDAFMQNVGGGKGLYRAGYTAALPVMMAQSGQSARPPSSSTGTPYSSEYVPGYTGAGPRMDSSEALYMNPRYIRRMADGGDTGMTGESDAYYRYLMGLAPAPRPATYAPPASYVPVGSSAASVSEALAPNAQLMAGNRDPYYDPSMGGDAPIPGNPDFMFDPTTGQLTPIVSALASVGNTLGITSPQQGALQGLPGLLMGNPLGILFGAAMGNAVQGQGMVNAHNSMIAANQGYAIPGKLSPGQAGFYAGQHPSAYSLGTDLSMLPAGGSLVLGDIEAAQTPIGGQGLHTNATGAGGVPGGLGINPNATGLGLTTSGANLSNFGYTPTDPTLGLAPVYDVSPSPNGPAPTGADEEDAAMGAAIAAAIAANNANAVDVAPDSGGGGDPTSTNDSGHPGDKRGGLIRKASGGLSSLAAFANGGYNLGDYSDGGRLLKGPGDGVSDSIPASIADKRPARLADGEFVVPARIVSELGNGSTDAGARRLYAMMDRIQQNRSKTTGKGKVAVNSRSDKYLPA